MRKGTWSHSIEDDLTADFQRKGRIHFNPRISSRWEWYQLMQHYGTPTRLLDWTEGSLIALFFAVRNLKREIRPAVWIINPGWLDTASQGANKFEYIDSDPTRRNLSDVDLAYVAPDELPAYPTVGIPDIIDVRIQVQQSCFTIHGSVENGIYALVRRENNPLIAKLILNSGDSPKNIKYI
jgi:hypothetical protein